MVHLKHFFLILVFCFSVLGASKACADDVPLLMRTSAGVVELDLFQDQEPEVVAYFLRLVKAKTYNNIIFHRIIEGFVIQGGAYDADFKLKNTNTTNIASSHANIKNTVATIAMVRARDKPGVLCAQYFINLADNPELDYTSDKSGYVVFGKVTKGMDVIQKLARVKVGQSEGKHYVPVYPDEVIVKSIVVK